MKGNIVLRELELKLYVFSLCYACKERLLQPLGVFAMVNMVSCRLGLPWEMVY